MKKLNLLGPHSARSVTSGGLTPVSTHFINSQYLPFQFRRPFHLLFCGIAKKKKRLARETIKRAALNTL